MIGLGALVHRRRRDARPADRIEVFAVMWGYGDYGMTGWMWVWGAALVVGVLVLLGGLVWAVVATTRRPAAPNLPIPAAVGPSSARQILD